jgi:hypothetical protein
MECPPGRILLFDSFISSFFAGFRFDSTQIGWEKIPASCAWPV